MKRYVLDAGVVVVLVAAVLFYWYSANNEDEVPSDMPASLVGIDASGNEVVIYARSDTTRLLVLFFQAHCWACVEQYPEWSSLIEAATNAAVPVAGVSAVRLTGSPPPEMNGIPVYSVVSLPAVRESLPILGVPTTVLLDPYGQIAFYKRGVLSEKERSDLMAQLSRPANRRRGSAVR